MDEGGAKQAIVGKGSSEITSSLVHGRSNTNLRPLFPLLILCKVSKAHIVRKWPGYAGILTGCTYIQLSVVEGEGQGVWLISSYAYQCITPGAFTPHACARGKVIGCVIISTNITISRDVGI